MNSIRVVLIAIFLLPLVFSCKKGSSSDQPIYMAFDHVEYVSDFPATFTLKDRKTPDIDVIGIRDFLIYDSIMVLGTSNPEGIWSIISLPHYKHLGSFLKRGEGPVEFMQGPTASSISKIVRENGQLVAYLYDFQKGNLKKFNLGQTLTSGELHISLMDASFPPFLTTFIMVDSTHFL